jgi:hypothetical protein
MRLRRRHPGDEGAIMTTKTDEQERLVEFFDEE